MLELYKGNNSDKITVLAENFDFTDAGWTAKLYILDKENNYANALTPKDMIKAADGKSFYVQLDPTETATLSEKKYLVALLVKNDTVNFKKDIYDELIIRRTYIP